MNITADTSQTLISIIANTRQTFMSVAAICNKPVYVLLLTHDRFAMSLQCVYQAYTSIAVNTFFWQYTVRSVYIRILST